MRLAVHWLWHFYFSRFVDVFSKLHHTNFFAEHFYFLPLVEELLVEFSDLVLTVLVASITLLMILACFLDFVLNLLRF